VSSPPPTWGRKQFQFPKCCALYSLQYQTMDKVQKPSNSECCTPLSEHFWIDYTIKCSCPSLCFRFVLFLYTVHAWLEHQLPISWGEVFVHDLLSANHINFNQWQTQREQLYKLCRLYMCFNIENFVAVILSCEKTNAQMETLFELYRHLKF
jgi:hypothetical protein